MQTILFDLSNIMYLAGYRVNAEQAEEDVIAQMITQAELFMRGLYKNLGADRVVFCCDSFRYWRRDIYPDYKGTRTEHALKKLVKLALRQYKDKHAKLCIEIEGCEGDDVIHACTKYLPGNKIIVSSDKDFVQLMSDSVTLFDPKTRTYRRRPGDVAFELFLKCIRGDRIDNIPSAFPRVQKKKLEKAFVCEKALQKILDTPLPDGDKVRDRYRKNKELIDLRCLPLDLDLQLKSAVETYEG